MFLSHGVRLPILSVVAIKEKVEMTGYKALFGFDRPHTSRDEVALDLLVKVYGIARSGLYRDNTGLSLEVHPVIEKIENYLILQGRIAKD